ncbi:MAG: 30S ribosomal protein S6 [Chlamydiia bacterium]|nr:30S ribosomal protein S6 [Chlamydiia bacterium]MCP5509106.1 30S ribosomal protein S6 [Chlamydiales bacterium]
MTKKSNLHLYEGMYIFVATLSDEARAKALEKITSGIEAKGGEIHKVHDRGRQKLAYDIKGKREGHYYLLYFSAPADSIKPLWRDYHLNEDLLRFMTMQTEEVRESIEFKQLQQQG